MLSAGPRSWKSWMWMVAALAVRVAFMLLHRIDSDEPQHLHVAWGWSRGLVQYRDLFDNHFPLLHLLFAPLVARMPETSDVFLWVRIAIAPVAIACAWLVYRIARTRLDEHRALIAAVMFSVLPPWLPKSVEFRNDTLWIFFWLAAIALIAASSVPRSLGLSGGGGPSNRGPEEPRNRAYFMAGVAAALCLLASVKALPLLLAHALALASQRRLPSRAVALRVACGAAIPLFAAALFLAMHGALGGMLYGTLLFNASLPVDVGRRIGGALAFAAIAPALSMRAPRDARFHSLLFAFWYCVVLLCFWPSITPRDFLPLVPLAAIALAETSISPTVIFVAATLAAAWYAKLSIPADDSRERFLDAAMRVTAPGDYVFDLKGDAVFRRRPVYTIYDIVGRALTRRGDVPDRAPEEIAARGCCVAIPDCTHLPPRARAFLNEHFIDAGAARVCGTVSRRGTFTIAVPQTYAVIAREPARVTIDGVPYRGPRFLAAGRHTLTSPEPEVTVIWWRAVQK